MCSSHLPSPQGHTGLAPLHAHGPPDACAYDIAVARTQHALLFRMDSVVGTYAAHGPPPDRARRGTLCRRPPPPLRPADQNGRCRPPFHPHRREQRQTRRGRLRPRPPGPRRHRRRAQHPDELDRSGKRAIAMVLRGNKSKGWRAFNGSRPVPAAEGAGTLTALTPQLPPPLAEEMADVDGTPKYDLNNKIFNAELSSLKACVGTGTLHSRYERIQGAARHGGRDYLFNIAHAVCRGEVHEGLGAELLHLRALCVYKPDGSHRPLGLPECETRFFLGCLAKQERPSWDAFYTSPLRHVAEAQGLEVGRAQEHLAQAETAGAEARAALASAALAQTNALQAAGLHLAVEAQERVLEAEGELQRRDAAIAEASAGLAQAKAPRNHPVNLAFSPGGSTALAQLVDSWHEAEPYNHTIPDDVENMYNTISLHASFSAIREHTNPTSSLSPASSMARPRPSGSSAARRLHLRRRGDRRWG